MDFENTIDELNSMMADHALPEHMYYGRSAGSHTVERKKSRSNP